MKRTTYNRASLERALGAFEERYGLPSNEFYEAHLANDERLADLRYSDRNAWASFYREARLGRGKDSARHEPRALQVA
jgi:hypothetical protein